MRNLFRLSRLPWSVLLFFAGCSSFDGCSRPSVAPSKQEQAKTVAPVLPPEPSMPPFSESLERMRSFYKIRFDADGYPSKLQDDGLYAHPIYGYYVIKDYVRQYKKEPSQTLADALVKVADAALSRMEEHEDALVFWYNDALIARGESRHYSGLTQAYYAIGFWQVYEITGEQRYAEASKKVFRSLLIPTALCSTAGRVR
jgi:hypothetical protein